MKRRTLLKAIPLGAASVVGGRWVWERTRPESGRVDLGVEPVYEPPAPAVEPQPAPPPSVEPPVLEPSRDEGGTGAEAEPDLSKIRDFDRTYDDDFILDDEEMALLKLTAVHLTQAQRTIGHGHFNVVSFDELLRYGRRYSAIGRFSPAELGFLEEIFFADAERYGFFGDKVTQEMTALVPRREIHKIADTGHYLFAGEPSRKYDKIRQDLGESVILTSGIRGVVKQYQLFLNKALETEGNLSQASRSLAPPGYSFHAAGDFDVGKVGFGSDNFTEAFAETDEYKKMIDLGYVEIRYTETNPFGVRHEPWHIKIS